MSIKKHRSIKTIMAGIYGGYGHENGLTSPTAEDPASVQPPNIAQWVILLLKHDY